MAKNGGNAVSPRRIIAGGFVFVGLFAMCFGLGSRSQALMVLGAAVIVLAFSVRLFSSIRRSPRQWVLGTAQVVEVSGDPPSDLPYGRCTIHLSVDAPGLPAESVHVTDDRVPVGLWPYPSQQLPVEVASDDPRHVRIRWNQLAPSGAGSAGSGVRTGQAGAGYAGDSGVAGGVAPDSDQPGPSDQDPDSQERAPQTPAREVRIDFDLDRPPPAAPRMDPVQAATQPVVTPLPAELGDSAGYGGPSGPDLPRPRRRPRPYPGQTQEPAALPAGTVPDGTSSGADRSADSAGDVGEDLDSVETFGDGDGNGTGTGTAAGSDASDSPDPGGAREPADLPEPVLAGAVVGSGGTGGPASVGTAGAAVGGASTGGPASVGTAGAAVGGASTGGPAGGGAGSPAAAAAGSRAASGTASGAAPGAASGNAPGAASGNAEATSSGSQTGPVGTFTNVGITVLVSDLHRSVAFYRDQLGFYEVDGGAGNAVLASGETRLVLRAAPELEKTRHRSVYLNLEVEDLEAVYTELRAGGVGFTNAPRRVDRTERLELWAATFRDPDGNGIALTQWRPSR